MKLDQWLTESGLSEREFALRIGRAQATVNRYRRGQRYPGARDMTAIARATQGAVTANDFYDLLPVAAAPAPEEAAA